MRTKIKIKIAAFLLCIVGGITLVCGQLPSFAKASISSDTIADLEEYAAELNQTLSDNNTTAEEQLELLSEKLEAQINQTTDGTQSNGLVMMKRFTNDLQACSMVTYSLIEDIINIIWDVVLATLNETERIVVLSYLTPMIGVLGFMGHDLTIELLVHSLLDQGGTEVYIPEYGYKARQSETFTNIANGSVAAGGAAFPKATWGTDGDLYLAIHGFSFTKPSSSSKTAILTDVYDYNDSEEELKKFPKIFHPIIKGMCALNRMGIATYYPLEITEAVSEDPPKNISSDTWGYEEYKKSFLAGELVDYKVNFPTSGSRMIQTFGEFETTLSVLDSNGKPLKRASGNGYSGNSFISYYFEANKNYIIRTAAKDKTLAGYGKVSIFYDNRTAGSTQKLNLQKVQKNDKYSGSASPNKMYMAEITPTESAKYKLVFTTSSCYCAYLIKVDDTGAYNCTFRTSSSNSSNGMNKKPIIIEDKIIAPDGGGEPDTIYQSMKAGETYLLAVCGYPAGGASISFGYEMSKV